MHCRLRGRNCLAPRDGDAGGDGVDGEDEVGRLDHDEDEEEGGGEAAAVLADEEPLLVVDAGHGDEPAGQKSTSATG